LCQFERVVDAAREPIPVLNLSPKAGSILRYPLGGLGLIPEIRSGDLFFQFG
jgi:hypothetical protein